MSKKQKPSTYTLGQFTIESSATVDPQGLSPAQRRLVKVLDALPFGRLIDRPRLTALARIPLSSTTLYSGGFFDKYRATRAHGGRTLYGNPKTIEAYLAAEAAGD